MSGELFRINSHYSFELFGGGVILNAVTNVKVTAMFNGLTAERLGYNVSVKHAQLYPYLKGNAVSKEFEKETFIEVEFPNGNRDAYGLTWIKTNTIKNVVSRRVTVTLIDVTPEAEGNLVSCLEANGYKVGNITSEEV